MALLVKEQKALDSLEEALVVYYSVILGEDLEIDKTKTVEERILYVATHIRSLL